MRCCLSMRPYAGGGTNPGHIQNEEEDARGFGRGQDQRQLYQNTHLPPPPPRSIQFTPFCFWSGGFLANQAFLLFSKRAGGTHKQRERTPCALPVRSSRTPPPPAGGLQGVVLLQRPPPPPCRDRKLRPPWQRSPRRVRHGRLTLSCQVRLEPGAGLREEPDSGVCARREKPRLRGVEEDVEDAQVVGRRVAPQHLHRHKQRVLKKVAGGGGEQSAVPVLPPRHHEPPPRCRHSLVDHAVAHNDAAVV